MKIIHDFYKFSTSLKMNNCKFHLAKNLEVYFPSLHPLCLSPKLLESW